MSQRNFDFNAARTDIANRAFETFDFGPEARAESAGGWESDGTRDVTRIVYLETGEEATIRASFHVLFKGDGTDAVDEVYALLMNNGGEIGHLPTPIDKFNAQVGAGVAA